MIGQGRPTSLRRRREAKRLARPDARSWCALTLALLLLVEAAAHAQETMRLRVAWGGGSERLWQGTIRLSEGVISQPQPLGIEADEPGSVWLRLDEPQRGNRLMIRQRSVRAYDAVDLLLNAPTSATLSVQFDTADEPNDTPPVEIPLASLVDEVHNSQLDDQGNRLVVRRAPGDRLRVTFSRDHLVFTAGAADDAEFAFSVRPHRLRVPQDSRIELEVRLLPAGGSTPLSTQRFPVQVDEPAAIPIRLEVPQEEGVYDVEIAVTEQPNWQRAVRRPLARDWTMARRKIQILVLAARPLLPDETPTTVRQVGEVIDPADPGWQETLGLEKLGLDRLQERLGLDRLQQMAALPPRWPGLMNNGNTSVWRHPLGPMTRLNPSNGASGPSWEAYRLPVDQPGRPHVLEVEYPSDVEQTLGISILEVNAAGAVLPIGLDSGVAVSRRLLPETESRRMTHRLIFWPKSKAPAPVAVLTNRRSDAAAVYGKLRVLSGWPHLPPASGVPPDNATGRTLLAYYDRPLFPENFSARGSVGTWVGRTLDDWGTFYQGGTRMVEYLRHSGYNGLVLSVLADGSSIYPSTLAEPTPRYDTGVFFETAQDPVRKDVLEMVCRLFDRQGMQLVPMLQFAAPLPELEAVRRRGGIEAVGLEWVGAEGTTWCQTHNPRRGLAPYYNVLHPRVQQAMVGVVRELADRYAHHPSFAGVAIQLSADGYAQLPGPEWGLDDSTMERFARDAKISLPGSGPGRFAERAAAVLGLHRRVWLQWRAARLAEMHRAIQRELEQAVARHRPQAQTHLYLAGAGMFDSQELQTLLRPSLPRRMTLGEAMLQVGIDARHYQDTPGIVLLRPQSILSGRSLGAEAAGLELDRLPDTDPIFRSLPTPGVLTFHPPQITRLPSLDAKSPFQPTFAELFTEVVPAGSENRRRLIRSLASLDCRVVVDGGWLLPMGQEDALREVVAAYRNLPPAHFERAGQRRGPDSSQPVTFRFATYQGQTYVYALNDGPFAVSASVRVNAPVGCRLEELTGLRQVAPLKRDAGGAAWLVELAPYDLVAVRLSDPGVTLSQPQAILSPSITAELGRKIQAWGARTAALRSPPAIEMLANPGFERPARSGEPLPGWATTQRAEVTIVADSTVAHSGANSVRMAAPDGWACLVSHPFTAPATGRLSMAVWLRVADAARQPRLRLAVEGRLRGESYYRYAEVGKTSGETAVPITAEWKQFVFPVDDLPLEGLSQLQVRLDLQGPGEVWVDDVRLYDLRFDKTEIWEMAKLVTLARVTLENGHVSDCVDMLDGYWSRLLADKVPLGPEALSPVARTPDPPADSSTAPNSPRTGWMNRLRDMVPRF